MRSRPRTALVFIVFTSMVAALVLATWIERPHAGAPPLGIAFATAQERAAPVYAFGRADRQSVRCWQAPGVPHAHPEPRIAAGEEGTVLLHRRSDSRRWSRVALGSGRRCWVLDVELSPSEPVAAETPALNRVEFDLPGVLLTSSRGSALREAGLLSVIEEPTEGRYGVTVGVALEVPAGDVPAADRLAGFYRDGDSELDWRIVQLAQQLTLDLPDHEGLQGVVDRATRRPAAFARAMHRFRAQ